MKQELLFRLEHVLGGDAAVEAAVLAFIQHQYKVDALFKLPEPIAREILKRPYDFIRRAQSFHVPELPL